MHTTDGALDGGTPVNPYSLRDFLNAAAARTNAMWLLFLCLMAYLALSVGALTHRDLLLDAGIALPLVGTRIDLSRFFVAAPAVLALAHVALIAQFVLLARKAVEFHNAVRLLESTDLRSHPLRLEVDSFFFVQTIAGPERSRIIGVMLHTLGWVSLLLLPLALLIYLQVAFLPVHDAAVTSIQRGIILADVAVLLLIGVFLLRAETSIFSACLNVLLRNPASAAVGLATLAGAAFVSLAATVPGAGAAAGTPLFGLIPRHLELADASLVSDRDRALAPIGGRTLNLRGRDLRFARLDRADLRQADLTGANLDGASLTGADLRGARLGCAKAGCTSAKGADFSGAQMGTAGLSGTDLTGARFDDASLERADLSRALLVGATFARAKLARAVLTAANLQAASLPQARLQGATLADARLAMADLTGAGLQGASLAGADLAGAVLREADLDGAQLQRAKLYGADLRGAKLSAADLAGAVVWRTPPPAGEAVALADIANIVIKAPSQVDIDAMQAAFVATEERVVAFRELLAGLREERWQGSADGQAWTALLRASEAGMAEGFKTRLSEHLAKLACRSRVADWVATAVVSRATGAGFKGDVTILNDRLKASDCPAIHTVPRAMQLELTAAAEAAKAALASAPPPAAGGMQGQ
jgi:uncharacterized protein YjbI with pentapeptide repeats